MHTHKVLQNYASHVLVKICVRPTGSLMWQCRTSLGSAKGELSVQGTSASNHKAYAAGSLCNI